MRYDRSRRDRRGEAARGDATPHRNGGRGSELHAVRDRMRIAQTAARLIVEHGITDWSLAKRKALRQLLLPESTALPSNEDLVQALTDHHALFGGEAHAASLRRQREHALGWMRRLEAWTPLLVGGVAAGWATEHSDVRIELVADDPKAVEIALASNGVVYTAMPMTEDAEKAGPLAQLRLASPEATLRLIILTPQQRRNRPRRDDEPRLSADALVALLA